MKIAALTATLLLLFVNASAFAADHMGCLMKQMMITGASVSAGQDGYSFGDQLAVKYHSEKELIRNTHPGKSGAEVISLPNFREQAKKASLVLALDFFYWDQFHCDETKLSLTIDTLFQDTAKRGIPLAVGNIVPTQEPFSRMKYDESCAKLINQKLKAACDLHPKKCLLVDNEEVAKAINRHFRSELQGLSATDRSKYIQDHITRDGLHPRTDAYQVMTEYLDHLLQKSALECR